jgi:hypothetical protein
VLARTYADHILVTTPDMLDFFPDAEHFPFFSIAEERLTLENGPSWPDRPRFKVVHVTGHPGIEGTRHIKSAVGRLQESGWPIEFIFLKDVPHQQVLCAMQGADLSIGKMKMGYYANAQIEALCCGVPTITYVRDEFMSDALRETGLIFATLDTLESTIEHYLRKPKELQDKRRQASAGIRRLHDNDALVGRLARIYGHDPASLPHSV